VPIGKIFFTFHRQTVAWNRLKVSKRSFSLESNEPFRTTIGGLLSDPRYSGNIFISDQPNESGRRVFFVDTGPNAQERTSKGQDVFARQVVGRLEEGNLGLWKRKLKKY
jgi:hypothetical protein